MATRQPSTLAVAEDEEPTEPHPHLPSLLAELRNAPVSRSACGCHRGLQLIPGVFVERDEPYPLNVRRY